MNLFSFKRIFLLAFILLSLNLFAEAESNISAAAEQNFLEEKQNVVFSGFMLKAKAIAQGEALLIDGKRYDFFQLTGFGKKKVDLLCTSGKIKTYNFLVIPGWLTVLPPLIAIILALIIKDVLLALFFGIFSGALLLQALNLGAAFLRIIDTYIISALTDRNRAAIVVFTLMLGGMVGIVSRAGGLKGIIESLSRFAINRRSTTFFTFLLGVIIFFDDYTNTLLVGNTMRPLSDRFRISREKLAYIVDSTAAPVASLAIISTWIGFEISLIDQSLKSLNYNFDSYSVFLRSVPYRLYPLLTLAFIIILIISKRDFGPMLKAERRARREGKVLAENAVPLSDFDAANLQPDRTTPLRWFNGIIPILSVILATICGLYFSGLNAVQNSQLKLSESFIRRLGMIITSADTFQVLLWASFIGVITALLLVLSQRIARVPVVTGSFVQGVKSMLMAIIILVLAWSLGEILIQLRTADYLVSALSMHLSYRLLPAIVFILSCCISFATGSSWGTVAILYPLVIPMLAALLPQSSDFINYLPLTVASIMSGAVFGDHCSPISDTTIMSSMASGCDHLDHVKTQLPYALTTAFFSFLALFAVSYGIPWGFAFLAAVIFIALFLKVKARKD